MKKIIGKAPKHYSKRELDAFASLWPEEFDSLSVAESEDGANVNVEVAKDDHRVGFGLTRAEFDAFPKPVDTVRTAIAAQIKAKE